MPLLGNDDERYCAEASAFVLGLTRSSSFSAVAYHFGDRMVTGDMLSGIACGADRT